MPVVSFADVTDGIHGSPVWVEEGGVTYLSAKCVKDNYFVLTDAGQISREQDEQNPRTRARLSDVLLTTVGTIGNAAVVYEDILPANMDRHLGIIRIRKNASVDPYYLAAFLNSEFGRFQTLREATGNVQLNLFIEKIKTLLVPTGDHFNEVGKTVRQAYQKQRDSEDLYAQAQALLTAELRLDRLDLSEGLYSVRRASEALQAGRIDAEYFQPKYEQLLQQLEQAKSKGWALDKLGNLSAPLRYGTSTKLEYLDDGVPFLRITDVRQYRFHLDEIRYISLEAAEAEQQAKVKTGDVLISRSGTLGLAVAIPQNLDGAVFGSYFIRTRPDPGKLDSVYLALYLNSLAGQFQVEQSNTGAIQTNLTIQVLETLQVVIPPMEIQLAFDRKVQQAFEAQDDAKCLLAEARAEVERMIEAA